MIPVVTHERGEVEGNRKAGLALAEQVLVAPVGLLGGSETGKLAHGPQAGTVHGRVRTPGEGEAAGHAEPLQIAAARMVGRVQRLDLVA